MVARARLTTILSDQDSGVKWACVATKDLNYQRKQRRASPKTLLTTEICLKCEFFFLFFSFEKRQEICLLIILLLERKTQVPIYRKKKEDRKTKQV